MSVHERVDDSGQTLPRVDAAEVAATVGVFELKASPGRCEEASTLSSEKYIPCNAPATVLVKHRDRAEREYRMCPSCADHNVRNRNAFVVRGLTTQERGPLGESQPASPTQPFSFPQVNVIEDAQQETALVPRVSAETIARIDDAVSKLEMQANAFACETPSDYAQGDMAVGRIRQLESLLKDTVYGPEKKFWGAKYDAVLVEEKKRLPLLERIKRTIGAKMIAWHAAEQQRAREAQRIEGERLKKEAEDIRLAQAQKVSDLAKQQGNAEMQAAAEQMLDEPLNIAPTRVQSVMPVGGATKIQQRDHIEVTDLGAALIAIGVTLAHGADALPEESRSTIEDNSRLFCKSATGILDSPKAEKNLKAALETWARDAYKLNGERFKVPGIFAGKKDVLG